MPDLSSGTILADRYRVVRVLGQGGMGMVLEVVHAQLGGRFALKLMHAEHARDTEMLARFENEARLAASLVSEHLVRVTDLGRLATGEPFLVMDYLDGLDLDQIIEQKRRVSIDEAVQWVIEASVGLAHLHAAGSVHRDVKPSNLFLANDPSGRQVVKVLDFGLARAPRSSNARLTATTANFGTPLYMSPEQILSAKHVDARTDQHALAHVLYEVLTGEPAFWGETPGAVTVAIATQPAPLLRGKRSDAPEDVERALARAMAKRPEDRFPSLAEFVLALAPFGRPADATRAAAEVQRLVGTSDPQVTAHARTALSNPRMSPGAAGGADATAVRPPDLSIGPVSTTNPKARAKRRSPLLVVGAIGTAAVLGVGMAVGYARWAGEAGSGGGSIAAERAADSTREPPRESAGEPSSVGPEPGHGASSAATGVAVTVDSSNTPAAKASATTKAVAPGSSSAPVATAPRPQTSKPAAAPSSTVPKPCVKDSFTKRCI